MESPEIQMLNQLDSLLKESFGYDKVTIDKKMATKFNQSQYSYQIVVESQGYEVKMIVDPQSLMQSQVNWSYFGDPVNEANLVPRVSSLPGISETISNIIGKKMFSSSYLTSVSKVINESKGESEDLGEENTEMIVVSDETNKLTGDPYIEVYQDNFASYLDNYGLVINNISKSGNDLLILNLSSKEYDGIISTATRVNIENTLNDIDGVNFCYFKDNDLVIHFDGDPELY